MAAMIASTRDLSRPSEKFGTHSISMAMLALCCTPHLPETGQMRAPRVLHQLTSAKRRQTRGTTLLLSPSRGPPVIAHRKLQAGVHSGVLVAQRCVREMRRAHVDVPRTAGPDE